MWALLWSNSYCNPDAIFLSIWDESTATLDQIFLFGVQFPWPSKKYWLWHNECSKEVSAITRLQSPYPSLSYPQTQIVGTWSVKKFPYPLSLYPVWQVGFLIGVWAGSIQFPFPSEWNPEAQVNI